MILWIALSLFAVVLLVPVVWAWRFACLFRPRPMKRLADKDLPSAAVVLSLRGADPSLRDCLNGLLAQDYPEYSVWIIVDSREDPAWDALHVLLAGQALSVPVRIQVLHAPRPTCSLKMSALLQAAAAIGPTSHVLALIDADVAPASDWLRSLVTPLLAPDVGATTGIRWYTPETHNWGTLVRYLWNAVANTQMAALGIPWGGSLAFRLDVIRRAGLLDEWSHCFCEDTSSARALWKLRLRVQVVANATAVSRETIELSAAVSFIRRQLVCSRLHHPSWPIILVTGWATAFALVVTPAFGMIAFTSGAIDVAATAIFLVIAHVAGVATPLLLMERRLRNGRGGAMPAFALSWRSILAIPFAHAIHIGCLCTAALTRRIDWRGITYELGDRGEVHLLQYHTYRCQPAATDVNASVS